jgi:hypothetical protein
VKNKILGILAATGILATFIFGLATIRWSFNPDISLLSAILVFVLGAILLVVVGLVLWALCDEIHDQRFRSLREKISQMQDSIKDSVEDDICEVLDGQQRLRELVKSIQAELADLKAAPRLSWLQKLLRRK